jgi:hypothetical protein
MRHHIRIEEYHAFSRNGFHLKFTLTGKDRRVTTRDRSSVSQISEISRPEAFEILSTNLLKARGSNDGTFGNATNPLYLGQEIVVEGESIEVMNNC